MKDLNSLRFLSFIYTHQSISWDMGKDVWIQYYTNEEMGNSVFSVGDSINMVEKFPTILLYVENTDDSTNKTYYVYRYNGELQIKRRIVGNFRHDILVNIDNILDELKNFISHDPCANFLHTRS